MFFKSHFEQNYIIQIHQDFKEIYVAHYALHLPLECGWGSGQSMGHSVKLEEPQQAGKKSSFACLWDEYEFDSTRSSDPIH